MIAPPDWHKPRNEACPHNTDVEACCTCKRTRTRKPFRTLRLHDATASHNVRKRFVVEVHCSNGLLVIREAGRTRKSAITVTIARIYERALLRAALVKRAQRAKDKRERKAARRKVTRSTV